MADLSLDCGSRFPREVLSISRLLASEDVGVHQGRSGRAGRGSTHPLRVGDTRWLRWSTSRKEELGAVVVIRAKIGNLAGSSLREGGGTRGAVRSSLVGTRISRPIGEYHVRRSPSLSGLSTPRNLTFVWSPLHAEISTVYCPIGPLKVRISGSEVIQYPNSWSVSSKAIVRESSGLSSLALRSPATIVRPLSATR